VVGVVLALHGHQIRWSLGGREDQTTDLAPGHETQRPEEVRLEDERDAQI
jgi:hypothetical protein